MEPSNSNRTTTKFKFLFLVLILAIPGLALGAKFFDDVFSASFRSTSNNISTSGALRLANTDSIGWRNNANNANVLLGVDTSDRLLFNGSIIATLDGTQTLTNKTLSGNTATNLVSGSGILTLNTSGTITIPNATDTLVALAASQTLTNKTITSPAINGANLSFGTASNSNRLLLPTETTTNLDALTDVQGLLGYDTTLNKPVFNNGSGWTPIGGGTVDLTTSVSGVLPIANGGTNNGSLGVTAGGVVYTDGSKLMNTGAGTNGYVLMSQGSSPPVWNPPPSGGGGINILKDYDWNAESGGTSIWSESGGGTLASTNTAANVANGTYAISFDASANNDYLASGNAPIPAGLYGQNCLADFYYKGFDSNITFQVHDGTNVVASQALTASTGFTRVQVNFVCPSSGNLQGRWLASANAAIGYVDEVHIGSATNVSNVTQAEFAGSSYFATTANCAWTRTNTAIGAFGTDADCPGPTIEFQNVGSWQTTDADLPQQTINSLPPGNYLVTAVIPIVTTGGAGSAACTLSDGTTTSGRGIGGSNTSTDGNAVVQGVFQYTSAGDRTFAVHCSITANSVVIENNTANQRLGFTVIKYPLAAQQAVNATVQNWRVDANISGANPSLGISAVTDYAQISNGSLTLTNNTGANVLTAQIPCTGGNASSGTTCSAGSEEIGVAFNLPRAGDVRACAAFGHYTDVGSAAATGSIYTTFQIVETSNTAETILQRGRDRLSSGNEVASANGRNIVVTPVKVCGTFTFSSNGQKTLKLFYEQSVSGTVSTSQIYGDAGTSNGDRDIHWEVYPIDQSIPAPTLVGGITNSGTGALRFEAAKLNCDASSAITSQVNGSNWIATLGNVSSGECTGTFTAGTFSATPLCICSRAESPITVGVIVSCNATSSTAFTVDQEDDAGNAGSAVDIVMMCMGPR